MSAIPPERGDTLIAIVVKNTRGYWNITMQKPRSGVTTTISITFAEAEPRIPNATSKKAAISSLLCTVGIVIHFPVNCYWWMLLFKGRLSLLMTVWKKNTLISSFLVLLKIMMPIISTPCVRGESYLFTEKAKIHLFWLLCIAFGLAVATRPRKNKLDFFSFISAAEFFSKLHFLYYL